VTGQVLVLPDLLGLNDGFAPKFLKKYADVAGVSGTPLRSSVRRSGPANIPMPTTATSLQRVSGIAELRNAIAGARRTQLASGLFRRWAHFTRAT
jgi:hypothetical protein